MTCVYCDHPLDNAAARPAFDPWLGRLWRICPTCGRWNVVPLEARWETLEDLERLVRDQGQTMLRSEHLDLVRVPGGEVVRIGRAPRPELAGWRYGAELPAPTPRGIRSWLRSVLTGLPSAPHGYDTSEIGSLNYPGEATRWFASPFLEDAPALTALFGHIPLAPTCPSCGQGLQVAPWEFQHVRLLLSGGRPHALARCAHCRREAEVPLADVRPVLRLGLFLVNRRLREGGVATPAASSIERADGPEGLVSGLSAAGETIGEAGPTVRLALQMALDELSESELLEAEWREAEELAAIVDGELTSGRHLDRLRRGGS